jgi:hypothetical protein
MQNEQELNDLGGKMNGNSTTWEETKGVGR